MSRLDMLLVFHEEDPEDGFVRFAIATEYRKSGRTEEALAWFERLLADAPDYLGTYYHLGRLYLDLGRTEDAVRTFERGIALATNRRDPHARSELQAALMEARGVGDEDS